ncbi:lysyl oxidase family protein [Amorphoplanes digitatis]|uniref:Lysyl oxidase n=1 Tax=Actinoplanes digitatis TaxID=1868 RepID=A0A7W7MUB0_9ACTN|nr:lysyl oxidase family protein [Actinoplanes digitatis]MBB4766414.1 hypothetical protein [Actinoplanes digitatis]
MTSRTRVLVAGAVVTAVGLTAAGMGVANAATDPPPLSFTRAAASVVAERYVWGDESYLNFDLGVHVIAGKDPFEIRAARKSYADPIVAEQVVVKNGKKKNVALPAGMVTGWGGLKDFTAVTIKNAAGAEVASYTTDFCPNSYESARTRRDAPAETPYPQGCSGDNPFTLGSVWGIQAGWNAPTSSLPRTGDVQMPDGDYTATVTLGKAYRDYFKIAADSATQTVNVKVETIDEGQGARSAKAPESFKAKAKAARAGDDPNQAAAVAEHSEHAGQGDESRQISAYKPEFRPPAKKPKAVKAASIPKGPRPDLRSLPAWGISLSQEEDGKSYVNFGATVWNGGTSPLLVDGFRQTGTELMDAYQYFFDAKGKEVGSVAAGTMEWDAREGHRHWHFTDFAQYNLLSSDKKQAVRSGKEAFCLVNTDAVDYTVPNAKWRPENTDLSSSCGQNTAVAVREVLDIGNGDTYSQQRPGQSFEITDLPNGTYYIEVKANPVNRLSEVSTTNNTSLRKIVLGGTPTERTLEVPPVNGIEG